jgi:hypothetical protein
VTTILHDSLPALQSGKARLPGTLPCDADDWLRVDVVYAAQMQYRARLLSAKQDAVLYEAEASRNARVEILTEALKLRPQLGFVVTAPDVTCPDKRVVSLDWIAPLKTLVHLVQEYISVLEKRGAEHVMTGAVLCFPANWRLADKVNRPLVGIHAPVDEYHEKLARHVQRLFDGVKAGQPLWRFNKLRYAEADLHQPYRRGPHNEMPFIRSGQQYILSLPDTYAVVFTIHTFVVHE